MEGWKCPSSLLTLQQVVEGSHANNLTKPIVKFLVLYGDFSKFDISLKLACFGANDVITF
jgi:hypothetical protein